MIEGKHLNFSIFTYLNMSKDEVDEMYKRICWWGRPRDRQKSAKNPPARYSNVGGGGYASGGKL